jgi:O-antigen/teichoic acid export membrane protein
MKVNGAQANAGSKCLIKTISKILVVTKGKLARDAAQIGIAKLLAVPFSLALSVILAKGLGPESYGRYAFAVSLLTLLMLLVAGGLASLLTREVAVARETGELGLISGITRVASLWILAGCVISVAAIVPFLLVSSSWFEGGIGDMLIIGLVGLPFACFVPVWSGILRGYGEAMKSQAPSLLALPIIQTTLVAALLATGRLDGLTAMLTFVFANLVVAAIGWLLVQRRCGHELREASPTFDLGAWMRSWFVLTQIVLVNYLNIQAGILLLGFLADAETVGAYHIADRVAQFVALSIGILEVAIAPYAAQAFKGGRYTELAALYSKVRLTGFLLALPVATPFVFLGAPIIGFVFGEAYVSDATVPLAILSLILLFRVATGPASIILVMSGHERITLRVQMLAVVLNILVSIILIPLFGATGAAIGAGVGTIVWSTLLAWQARRILRAHT